MIEIFFKYDQKIIFDHDDKIIIDHDQQKFDHDQKISIMIKIFFEILIILFQLP